jgi:putative transposase
VTKAPSTHQEPLGKVLRLHGARQSVSRPGNPYDNAVMESFFKTLKRELVNDRRYTDLEDAKQDIFKYIELYYNTRRRHSALGNISPRSFECKIRRKPLSPCPA